MAKRILITSTDLMMVQFLVPHIRNLAEHGYEVDIACSNVSGHIEVIRNKLKNCVKVVYTVQLRRSPFSCANIRGYREIKKIIDSGNYDIIWTNEPVMGTVTRLAARKTRRNGTRIVYMVHGFHFYQGAPTVNWLTIYPIERLLAFLTDYIITVNQEDYVRARRFPVKHVYHIQGIGADTDRLQKETVDQNIRSKLEIPRDAFLILSVGELNANKNQRVIIEALSILQDRNIYYVLCGSGKNRRSLQEQAQKNHLEKNIHFIDYRRDIVNFYDQADVFALPSYREGLPIALLEAMYCGVVPVTSDIRGARDIMQDGVTGIICDPEDSSAFADAIKKLKEDSSFREQCAENSKKAVKPYLFSLVRDKVLQIFEEINGADK